MDKITNYIIIMTGLMLFFHIGGLIEIGSTPNSVLMNLLTDPNSIANTNLWNQVILAIQAVTITSVVILGFINRNAELAAMGPFAIYLLNILLDFLAVFQNVYSQNKIISVLLFSPILILYVITIIQFWRGKD